MWCSLCTLYQRVLGDRFACLPAGLRTFLGNGGAKQASGPVEIVRQKGWLRNRIASLLGIPPAGHYHVRLEVIPVGRTERWLRRFAHFTLETRQRAYRGLLLESSGPGSIGFELVVRDGDLYFHCRRAWVFGVPVPLWLAPRIASENRAVASGGWSLSVRFSVPGLGQIAEYRGEVQQII
jgi:hypothetical protein